MNASATPSNVTIKPRHPSFDLRSALGRNWHGGNAFKTAFFNALSLTFPVGEKYFIDSVRAFEAEIDDGKLMQDVRGFIGQEAVHRREHRSYNDILCDARGYEGGPAFEAALKARVDAREDNSRFASLMETVCFEHLTAVLAHGLLTDPHWLEGADPTLKSMWQWHAIEEAEHKAVTFDVYRAVGGDMDRLKFALPFVTRQMFADILGGTWMMLKSDGQHLNPMVWASGINWLFGWHGVVRRLIPQWRQFRKAGFHPWDHDNRDRIADWRANAEPELLHAV